MAAKRGVKIEIFHSHRDALGPSIIPWIPSFYMYKKLIAAGIIIYENRQCEHSKILFIDNKDIVFGSYNFEYAAHDRMAEAMMVSSDLDMIKAILSMFEDLRMEKQNSQVNDISATWRSLPRGVLWKVLCGWPIKRWL